MAFPNKFLYSGNFKQKKEFFEAKINELKDEKSELMRKLESSVGTLNGLNDTNYSRSQRNLYKQSKAESIARRAETTEEKPEKVLQATEGENSNANFDFKLSIYFPPEHRIFTSHPSISRIRVMRSFHENRSQLPTVTKSMPPDYESDEQEVGYVSHPMTNPLRNPDIAERLNPTFNYIEHPNIKLDRIKEYKNYAKKYSSPVFLGIPKKSSSKNCKCQMKNDEEKLQKEAERSRESQDVVKSTRNDFECEFRGFKIFSSFNYVLRQLTTLFNQKLKCNRS